MSDVLRISSEHRDRMLEHVVATDPEEACGFVGGSAGTGHVIIPVTNALHSATRFRMDAAEQVAAILALESRGWDVLAIYHSHPSGPDFPSGSDLLEFSYPGAYALIWSHSGPAWALHGFSIVDQDFQKIVLLTY